MSERRIRGSVEDPPEDRCVARSTLVGSGTWRASSLLPLSPSLSYSSRPGRILLYSNQSRRKVVQPRIWLSGRIANRPHREKTAEPFLAGHARVQHGNRRLKHGVLFLPELGHFEI